MTAEEFLISKSKSKNKKIALSALNNSDYTIEMMVSFAKYHVEKALKDASKYAKTGIGREVSQAEIYKVFEVNKDSILNAYSLKNIK